MSEGPPTPVVCPVCGKEADRIYTTAIEIWHTDGSSRDYFDVPQGRGQPMDKRENLNYNWSKHYGKPPPPPDSVGTYDGIPRPRQVVRKKK